MYINSSKSKDKQTGKASKYPQGYFKAKNCKHCTNEFTPVAPSELYCSDECKDYVFTDLYLQRTYSISLTDYKTMYDTQEGLCAICRTEGFTMANHHKMKLAVDHCHTTGKVRGLLCHNCNRALGLFKDNPEAIERAMKYVSSESATTIPRGSTPKQVEAVRP